jgi:glycolate oxidase
VTDLNAVDDAVIDALRTGLPEDAVITDPDLLASYQQDHASLCAYALPAVAVTPRSTEQVQHVMRVASAHRVPVVPQGARSGLAGGANTVDGCIALSLHRMNRVLEIDPVNRIVVTEPGIMNAELSRAVLEKGLFYPPDPSSWEFCSIGGNLSTNAGGLCCVKYGVTTEYVLGLEVVLATGELLKTGRRTVKGVAGYDLTRLIVGSEGTLGVITQATLLLRPAPDASLTMAALFDSAAAACAAVTSIVANGLSPSMLEIIDRTHLRAVEAYRPMGLGDNAECLILAQSDTGERAAGDLAEIAARCEEAGAFEVVIAEDAAESEMLMQARRLALLALEQFGIVIIDDVSVPRSRLVDLIEGCAKIGDDLNVTIGVVGHAGDGNMHPNIVVPRDDPEALSRGQRAFDAIMRLGLDLGGTCTGEHGVGLLKRDWLRTEVSDVNMRLQHAIKDTFDPLGILNPGKVL